MRTGRDITKEYFKADKTRRFEYLYDNFRVRESLLDSEKFCLAYMIETAVMNEAWSEYCKCFIGQKNRIHTQRRIYECLKNDEPIDCLPDGVELSERVIDAYKNICLMKVEFDLFANTLKTLGKPDEDLLRRYITKEITLWDIADERKIAYETAKGKVRDLKKTLKMRTIPYLV